MYKIRWINKKSGYVGMGNVLTKEIDIEGLLPFRASMDFNDAEKLCKYANRNYRNALHVVVEVCNENKL